MTMNCRSGKNKIADIAAVYVIDENKPDIWLNSNIESNEIFQMAIQFSETIVLMTDMVEGFFRQ